VQILKKIYLALCKCRDITIIATVTFVIGLVLVQIFLRYVATGAFRPFAWGDELIRNLSAWMFFLGASLAAREGSHISLEVLVKKLFKGKARFIVEKLVGLVCLVVIGLVIVVGFRSALGNPASMVNLPSVPMTVFYMAIPVGMSFVFIDFLLVLIFGYHPFSKKVLAAEEKAASERAKWTIETEREVE
jgi:TRAP-type C4-dicarboxylate transport system permease small subunit